MKIFLVAEAFILVFALFIAVLRGLPGPVFFPIRTLATIYADLFRGIPTILVIYILGFGVTALQLPGVPDLGALLGHGRTRARVLGLRVRGVPSRNRVGPPEPGSSSPLAGPQSLPDAAPRRHPAGGPTVIPPLLNDFIGLQKDTALVALLGVVEAFRQSQIDVSATFNYTPYICTAILFIAITVPLARFTDWLVARDRRRQLAGGMR